MSKKKDTLNKKNIGNKILGIFSSSPRKTYNYKQLAGLMHVTDVNGKRMIIKTLEQLTKTKNLEEVGPGKYKLKSKQGFITGKVDMSSSGFAYIVSDELQEDVFVSFKNLHGALHGDTVKVFIYAAKKKGNIEGEVIEIIDRAKTTFVGTIEASASFAFLIPDNKKMPYDIFIPLNRLHNAKNGQKAIVKILEWPQKAKNPIGEVQEILGDPGNNETEMHAILAEFGLPVRFSQEVESAANAIKNVISPEEYTKRRDFRNITTFTIDPADAKDFDDALSIEKKGDNIWEIGVHIADVSFFVTPGSVIDQEAYNRATSVYLVDRVVPMIPEHLSNVLCSLRPKEEKLCFSAVFTMNNKADVLSEWYGRTIIASDYRFTYEEAQKIIETKEGILSEEILFLHELAQKLRKKRFKNGSIGFDRVEVKFEIDNKGKPLRIMVKENKEANQLIEEFMLLANRKVAELFKPLKKSSSFVYRVHDNPDMEKLKKIRNFIKKLGYTLDLQNSGRLRSSINMLLDSVQGKKEEDLIVYLLLRAMAKAKYTTKNIGHYGLAFEHYTHFTSPIRRYPDIMVHRMLQSYIDNKPVPRDDKYETMCRHASDMEMLAIEAERATIKYKQVEFMKDKVGQRYKGLITGVAKMGFFVEIIENKCEGLVPIALVQDEFYEYDEDNFCMKGKRFGRKFQLGDEVFIEVLRINLPKRQIDFKLVE